VFDLPGVLNCYRGFSRSAIVNDTEPSAGSPADRGANVTAPAETGIQEFSLLVAGMSRLLAGLGQLEPFSEGGLSLAEWVSLTILAQRDERKPGKEDDAGERAEAEKDIVSYKWIAQNLGVTGQRANQIAISLARGGYVTIDRTRSDLSTDVKITAVGIAKLDAINAELQPLLARALKEGSLAATWKRLQLLSHDLRVGKLGKSPGGAVMADRPGAMRKKAKKKAKKAEAPAKEMQ
jgi:DNA-binding MarR family transcriptional regulator